MISNFTVVLANLALRSSYRQRWDKDEISHLHRAFHQAALLEVVGVRWSKFVIEILVVTSYITSHFVTTIHVVSSIPSSINGGYCWLGMSEVNGTVFVLAGEGPVLKADLSFVPVLETEPGEAPTLAALMTMWRTWSKAYESCNGRNGKFFGRLQRGIVVTSTSPLIVVMTTFLQRYYVTIRRRKYK